MENKDKNTLQNPDAVTNALDRVADALGEVKKGLAALESRLDSIEETSKFGFDNLEARVKHLERGQERLERAGQDIYSAINAMRRGFKKDSLLYLYAGHGLVEAGTAMEDAGKALKDIAGNPDEQ